MKILHTPSKLNRALNTTFLECSARRVPTTVQQSSVKGVPATMLYMIRCNPMYPLCGALPVPYVPVWIIRGALVAHRYTCAPPRCRTTQYRCSPLFPPQWPSGTILLTLYSMVRDWRVCQEQSQHIFYWPKLLDPFVSPVYPFLYFLSIGWYFWARIFRLDRVKFTLS